MKRKCYKVSGFPSFVRGMLCCCVLLNRVVFCPKHIVSFKLMTASKVRFIKYTCWKQCKWKRVSILARGGQLYVLGNGGGWGHITSPGFGCSSLHLFKWHSTTRDEQLIIADYIIIQVFLSPLILPTLNSALQISAYYPRVTHYKPRKCTVSKLMF